MKHTVNAVVLAATTDQRLYCSEAIDRPSLLGFGARYEARALPGLI
jgi:hypothetical protein